MAQNRDSEYAMQHFGFQPEELADEFNQSTVELLSNALNAMRSKLLEKQPNLGEEEVQKSFERLEQIYTEKMEKVLCKVGSHWAAHVFRIPSHVLLPEDEAWDGQTQSRVNRKLEDAEARMEEERDRIQNLIYKREVLRKKLGKVEQAIAFQEQVLAEDLEVKRALGLDSLDDGMAAISISSRFLVRSARSSFQSPWSLQSRKEDLEKVQQELGISESQTPTSKECKLFTRAKRQKIEERGAQVLAQLGI